MIYIYTMPDGEQRGLMADEILHVRGLGVDGMSGLSPIMQAREAIGAIVPAGTAVDVRLVWDPPWTPDRMTGIAREHFGWT